MTHTHAHSHSLLSDSRRYREMERSTDTHTHMSCEFGGARSPGRIHKAALQSSVPVVGILADVDPDREEVIQSCVAPLPPSTPATAGAQRPGATQPRRASEPWANRSVARYAPENMRTDNSQSNAGGGGKGVEKGGEGDSDADGHFICGYEADIADREGGNWGRNASVRGLRGMGRQGGRMLAAQS
jgi:hypothetical protein